MLYIIYYILYICHVHINFGRFLPKQCSKTPILDVLVRKHPQDSPIRNEELQANSVLSLSWMRDQTAGVSHEAMPATKVGRPAGPKLPK